MTMSMLIHLISSLQTRVSKGFTDHLRIDGSMFYVILFEELVVIILDRTEGKITKLHENVEHPLKIKPSDLTMANCARIGLN